jgi:trehalose 6-phosphate synthase
MPSRCNFDPDYWEIYQRVNGKFAEAVTQIAKPGDFIWVHDYHLMLMAASLRKAGVKGTIGFFLHIPFPSPDVFEKLPWRKPMLEAMLSYDVIGFQADRDRDNFRYCVQRLLPEAKITSAQPRLTIEHAGHEAVLGTFPISIDFEEFAQAAAKPEVASRASAIRRDLSDSFLVLGVDRLDYTKGIPERLRSFRVLLRNHPDLRGRITLVQIVVPSREDIPRYKDLRTDLELLVSRINGEFTQAGWVPIHYMHRNLGRDELLAYYRAADIALVTPLKDGMNLVAKEFCAAQVDERGVLIVSEFAGAGPELRQGALVVNPNDFAAVAKAIHQACVMPVEQKRERMRLLRRLIRENDVQRWAESFMDAARLKQASSRATHSDVDSSLPTKVTTQVDKPADVPGLALVAKVASHRGARHGHPHRLAS